MKHKDGSKKPSYNCQVAVDEKEQIIVAADVVIEENDLHQVEPMIENVKETLGCKPTIVLEDAGYLSYDNVEFGSSSFSMDKVIFNSRPRWVF